MIEDKKQFTLNYEPQLKKVYEILIFSVKEYFNKHKFKCAVLGLSGGLDSTICAVILADALGAENVFSISMPSSITSSQSKQDAIELANNLRINYIEHPITEMINVCKSNFDTVFNQVEKVWTNRFTQSYTNDNIQARLRAMVLFGISNEFESTIPIATSDKSESYMGYATINGDMSGGYAPIADVTKTMLFALGHWLNKNRPQKNVIPISILNKRPTAELAINPKTNKPLLAEEALMPYEFLDEAIFRIENQAQAIEDMLNDKFLYELKNEVSQAQKQEWLEKFFHRMKNAQFKKALMPPFPKIKTTT